MMLLFFSKVFIFSPSVPPVRARLVREWSYFLSGKSYDVRCRVEGSHPTAYAKVCIWLEFASKI